MNVDIIDVYDSVVTGFEMLYATLKNALVNLGTMISSSLVGLISFVEHSTQRLLVSYDY